jgi:hypothetical protein
LGVTEFWTDAELEALFKRTNELPFYEHCITAYGKGIAGPSDAPIIEAIASIPGIWYIHHNGVQGDLTIKALSTPGASRHSIFPSHMSGCTKHKFLPVVWQDEHSINKP